MASGLTIPEEHRPALLILSSLPEDAFDELYGALEKAPLKFRTDDLVRLVALALLRIQPGDAAMIVESLRDLALVRSVADVSIDEFANDVADALSEGTSGALPEGERPAFVKRLQTVLDLPSIQVPSKARSLLLDHAHSMCRARIFTDVRPVFGSEVDRSPDTALVVHTLKLTYHQGASTRDFFVALDRSDLEVLSDLIERAKVKERSLHAALSSAGLKPIDTE